MNAETTREFQLSLRRYIKLVEALLSQTLCEIPKQVPKDTKIEEWKFQK